MKTKSMKMSRNLIALMGMWLLVGAFLVFGGNARAQEKLAPEITTTTAGGIDLSQVSDSPVYVEFEKSEGLTEQLQGLLAAQGFVVVTSKEKARTVVTMSGQLVLMGGPVFYKGAQLKLGEVAQRSIDSVKPDASSASVPTMREVVTVGLNAAAYASSVNGFMSGLHMSRMVDVIGDRLGLKASFNTALTGDPRGWCLSKCDDFKKVTQTAYLVISVKTADGVQQQLRVRSTAFSETLVPDDVVSAALEKGLLMIDVKQASVALAVKN